MPFYVATNRQKPPENNAFARRAKMKRGGPIEVESAPEPEMPEVVPDPDTAKMQALLEAAKYEALAEAEAVKKETAAVDAEPKGKPGRAKSQATLDREAKVLEYVTDAQQVGVTKSVLAKLLGSTPQQINTALQTLAAEGKVESRPQADSKALLWFAR